MYTLITMRLLMFTRHCPQCNTDIIYKTVSYFNESIRSNRLCRPCASKNKANTRKYKGSLIRVCTHCQKSHTFSCSSKYKNSIKNKPDYVCKSCSTKIVHTNKSVAEKTKEKLRNSKLGFRHTEETKKRMSEAMKGKNNPMYGVVRHDIRKKYLDFLVKQGINPKMFYNPIACKLIDEYGKTHGYNFQHAMNGGEYYIRELGYSVDGYDKEKNVVIEYYENYHTRPRQVKKDLERQKLIQEFLKCEFIILLENDKGE